MASNRRISRKKYINSRRKPARTLASSAFEAELRNAGHSLIAGVDEAGRGPLAGPVCAAAVILEPGNVPQGLTDSKMLSAPQREDLFDAIVEAAISVGIGLAPAQEIDRLNIRQATFCSMTRAVQALACLPDFTLIDGRDVPPALCMPTRAIIKGDSQSVSIAAASIIAKVTRDRLMTRLAGQFPVYGFDRHMGYPTRAHRDQIARHGPSPFHRLTFAPLKHFPG